MADVVQTGQARVMSAASLADIMLEFDAGLRSVEAVTEPSAACTIIEGVPDTQIHHAFDEAVVNLGAESAVRVVAHAYLTLQESGARMKSRHRNVLRKEYAKYVSTYRGKVAGYCYRTGDSFSHVLRTFRALPVIRQMAFLARLR
jgi:hypothetical protein